MPTWLYGWVLPVIILALWEAGSALGLLSDSALPAPSRIARTFWQLCVNGHMTQHLTASTIRASGGFLLGAVTGLLLGVFTGLGKWAEQTLDPTIRMRTVPLLAVIPLFILWFGVGELSKVLLIALGSFFPLYFHTHLGVQQCGQKAL